MKDKIKARSVPFSQTRSRHAGETAEDYVEAVMELIEEQGECRVLDLAGYFNVSHVTVSRIVKRLQNENLLHSKPYRPVELTDKGSKLAKRVKERHEIVLAFLNLLLRLIIFKWVSLPAPIIKSKSIFSIPSMSLLNRPNVINSRI